MRISKIQASTSCHRGPGNVVGLFFNHRLLLGLLNGFFLFIHGVYLHPVVASIIAHIFENSNGSFGKACGKCKETLNFSRKRPAA